VTIAELQARFADVVVSNGRWKMPVTCHLLRSSGVSILVDTGVGPWLNDDVTLGHLDAALGSAGLMADDVDVVITTHLHFDHVGWNTSLSEGGAAVPHFANATYRLSAAEWTYLASEMARRGTVPPFFERCVGPLESNGCLRLVDPPFAVTDEVAILPAPGHAPGHIIVRVESRGDRATIIGDASHHSGQVMIPAWSPLWDENPETAIDTRRELFASLAGNASHRVVAGHWG
jgi:glyoxylase-like metal-dependent hydrolase (beta-lactamase superfamily II)